MRCGRHNWKVLVKEYILNFDDLRDRCRLAVDIEQCKYCWQYRLVPIIDDDEGSVTVQPAFIRGSDYKYA